ncbi:MAG: hypothetical protein IPO78_03435 [Saprospiraceae bacterium]|nr:hypothetical protein [Saprospiraceae bacterium]MBK8450849.1 hypothetical protein [Saprospiraceae bacterium]MBK9223125.1 hypothetical protein [Saprospiraceae bacterium]MBK9720655.1 hypothetical protein [Saprospiraceae bacterium]MBK9727644.1 hypothetical protein [Saprospiraceae bacterium]
MWSEIQNAFEGYFQSTTSSIPSIVNALIILIIGWTLAKVIQWIVFKLSHALGIDRLAQKSGVHRFLEKRGIKKGFSGLTSSIFFWMIILIVMVKFFNLLGLDIVSDLLNQFVFFIPNVLIACVLIILGFYLAEFVSSLVVGSLEESSFENPELIGKLIFYCIGFFTIAIALTQIGIGEAIITNVVSIFFGSIGLAFALAFGLGGKDWAAKILSKYFWNNNEDKP